MMKLDPKVFSLPERGLALLAAIFNLFIGLGFFFLPELKLPLWPTPIAPVLARFIGAIILGNSAGAFWLATEREWARVRALALTAVVYGTLVMIALLGYLFSLAPEQRLKSPFLPYLFFDTPFLLVFYVLFVIHDIMPFVQRRK